MSIYQLRESLVEAMFPTRRAVPCTRPTLPILMTAKRRFRETAMD